MKTMPITLMATLAAALLAVTAVALGAEQPDCTRPIGALSVNERDFCEAVQYFRRFMYEADLERAQRPPPRPQATHVREPGEIDLCPAPHRMTENGCR